MKLLIRENDAYPNDWKPSRDDIDKVFSALDQSKSKNQDFLNDNFGFSKYTVKFGDSRKTYISVYAAMDKDGYRVDETFYISPDEKRDTYKISTEELGERTVGKSTDVWDIISTCLRKQLKTSTKESVKTRSRKTRVTEDFYDDEEDYYDVGGYYKEEYMDYLEALITLTVYTFTEPINKIRDYVIEEAARSRDYSKISLGNYKLYTRNNELVDLDGDPYELDGQEVVDLVVRFEVDVNGDHHFNEYGIEESIREIRRYLK